mmetsp:Transcript_42858/g.126989  ORF Transcript_42858/g.126989 Transcript_42858/m.126989 type:complete len:245 (-) Transcript_42858:361-1095(-)
MGVSGLLPTVLRAGSCCMRQAHFLPKLPPEVPALRSCSPVSRVPRRGREKRRRHPGGGRARRETKGKRSALRREGSRSEARARGDPAGAVPSQTGALRLDSGGSDRPHLRGLRCWHRGGERSLRSGGAPHLRGTDGLPEAQHLPLHLQVAPDALGDRGAARSLQHGGPSGVALLRADAAPGGPPAHPRLGDPIAGPGLQSCARGQPGSFRPTGHPEPAERAQPLRRTELAQLHDGGGCSSRGGQ